jgi:hypothetical protein
VSQDLIFIFQSNEGGRAVTPWLYESCLDCNEKLIFVFQPFMIPFVMVVDVVAVFVLSVVFL